MDTKKIIKFGIPVLVIIGLGVAAAKYLDSDKTLQAINSFNYYYTPAILFVSSVYLLVKGWRFVILMRPVTALNWRSLLKVYFAGRSAALVPGGSAARVALLEQAGVGAEVGSAPVALSSLFDYTIFITATIVGAFWIPQMRLAGIIFSALIVVVGLILAMPLTRKKLNGGIEELAKEIDLLREWRDLANSLEEILDTDIILKSLGLSMIAFVLYAFILFLSFLSFGATVSYPSLVIAVSFPTMLGRLSGLPGGIGVTGAGMLGALISFSDVSYYVGAVTIIIFRMATVLYSAVVGVLIYLFIWNGEEEAVESAA